MPDIYKHKVSFHSSRIQGNYENIFNSNFYCESQTTSNFDLGDSKISFQYLTEESNLDKSFNKIIEESGTFKNTIYQKPNYNYYHNHRFRRLVNKLPENKTFILLHLNIYLLQGNFDNLQNVMRNLGHKFNVITASQIWAPSNDKGGNKTKTLQSYQNYHGAKGKSLKKKS